MMHRRAVSAGTLALVVWGIVVAQALAARGELELTVTSEGSLETMVTQIQLRNGKGRLVRAPGLPQDGSWQLVDGTTVLALPPGPYTFRLRRGLEYRERTGQFLLKSGDADHHDVDLPRFVTMSEEGWWAGDLEVYPRGPAALLATRILASDIHLVSPIRWTNPQSRPPLPVATWQMPLPQLPPSTGRWLDGEAGLDRRSGSVSLVFGVQKAWELPASSAPTGSFLKLAETHRRAATGEGPRPWLHLSSVTHWDLPVLVASDLVDSVGVLHSQLTDEPTKPLPQARPHDALLFPEPAGAGEWAARVYFHLLEAGLRIPPAAGSGSGVSINPLGFHRVYVQCENPWKPVDWWEGLRAGRVVVTNGPLLRPRVNGQWPGHVFRAKKGETLELECELNLATQDKIQYLEIIQNGRPIQQVRLEEWKARQGQLPPVKMTESGWLLIRVVADHPSTYRAAMSGPFYVEFDDQPRVSRQAAQFFVEWLDARAKRTTSEKPEETESAVKYWKELLERATAP